MNLFLCKVVDEKENPSNLKFYWRGMAYDTDFDLQDRLQQLYQQGMKQFLGEDVTYINQQTIDEAFTFIKDDPDATRETINRYFKQLKFFTNNDFAFIDVHNEKLFYQNAIILLRIVEMLQDIHLKNDSDEHNNQFLGDMFEGFLDAGVKQSEGQFFTPMPIVKFIMNSLPLEQIIVDSEQPPKAIDYACGAGHFLTELARQLKPLVEKYKKSEIKQYYRNITGLEKEYRLSKVAKVSAFMYGQDDINIIYADALARNANIEDGTYNILVANPPYSVKGFLETLTMPEKRSYELLGSLDNKSIVTNNAIETFFIERAKQLLVSDGIAAIILPSSILSNDAKLYQRTREILIKYFHIIAIAELGSGTFGKTGTNTVTLFLKRRKREPAEADHYKNRVESWLHDKELNPSNKKNKLFNDLHLAEAYCEHIGIAFNDYKQLWIDESPNETIEQSEMWQDYQNSFYNRTEVKNLQKRAVFKRLDVAAQKVELNQLLFRHVKQIEKEKVYYFLLVHSNSVPVLIIKSPSDNKAAKKFLGYEWSAAKGNEGIKYFNAAHLPESDDEPALVTAQLNSIQTPLYNPTQKEDATKLNYYIQQNYIGISFTIPESLNEFAHIVRLQDMLDFNRKDFNKAISLSSQKTEIFVSKWEIKKLGEVCKILIGGTPPRNNQAYFEGNNLWVSISEMKSQEITDTKEKITNEGIKNSNVKLIPKGTTLLSFKLSIGKTAIAGTNLYTNEAIAGLIPVDKKLLIDEYLFQLFNSKVIDLENVGNKAFGKSLNSEFLKSEVKIPIPPIKVQQSIITECRSVDKSVKQALEAANNVEAEINKKIEECFKNNFPLFSLSQIVTTNPSKTEIKDLDNNMSVSFVDMDSVNEKGYIEKKEDRTLKSLRKGSYTYFAEEDIIIAKITPCMENGKCALAKSLTNAIALGSSEFHVFRVSDKILPEYLFYHLNRQKIRDEAEKKMTGASGHRRVPISFYENLKIPVPSIQIQQQLVEEIEILEAQIATSQIVIDNAPGQKQAILKKWLE
ncbi:MAG TPA: N-6 DNA methylase [Chitinophagaceae bacterium]